MPASCARTAYSSAPRRCTYIDSAANSWSASSGAPSAAVPGSATRSSGMGWPVRSRTTTVPAARSPSRLVRGCSIIESAAKPQLGAGCMSTMRIRLRTAAARKLIGQPPSCTTRMRISFFPGVCPSRKPS